jgi:TetR/AcrR family transcriptional regulator
VGVALSLFAEREFEGVSVRDIAERAGTTHGLIRHHFGSKEGVWRAAVDTAGAEYEAALRPLVTGAAAEPHEIDAVPMAAAIVHGLVMVSARHPEIARLLVREGASGEERLDYIFERTAPLRKPSAPLFARLQRQGLLRQFDRDTFFLFLLTAGVVPFALSALSEEILGTDILAEQHAERHADRIVRTLFGDVQNTSAKPH